MSCSHGQAPVPTRTHRHSPCVKCIHDRTVLNPCIYIGKQEEEEEEEEETGAWLLL